MNIVMDYHIIFLLNITFISIHWRYQKSNYNFNPTVCFIQDGAIFRVKWERGGGLRFTTKDVINLIFSWVADDLEFVDRKYWPVCRSMIGFDWAGHCWNWNDWT